VKTIASFALVAASVVLTLAGCNLTYDREGVKFEDASSGGSLVTLSCDHSGGWCDEVTGTLTLADVAAFQSSFCTGTYAEGPCSASTLVGYCDAGAYPDATGASLRWIYYVAGYTQGEAEASCSLWAGAWAGSASCLAPRGLCPDDAGNTCKDQANDPSNCGACGAVCVSTCASSTCDIKCDYPSYAACGAVGARFCVDRLNDPTNCGSCGNACGAQACVGGTCVAPAVTTEVEPHESTLTATVVPLVGSVIASISPVGDLDYFAFTVPAGGLDVRFQTFDSSGVTCSSVDPKINVFDGAGRYVGWADNAPAPSTCEDLTLTLPAATFYVEVTGNGSFLYVLKMTATTKSPAIDQTISCTDPPGGICSEMSGPLSSIDLAQLGAACSGTSVAFAGPCATAGAATGHCHLANRSYGADTAMNLLFYSPAFDAPTAMSACSYIGGTWVSP
jgi:hypothetical protein